MNVGKNIMKLRKEHNLTQEELANILFVSPKTVSSYETNRSLPNIEILITIAKAFNVKIDSILNMEDKDNLELLNQSYKKMAFKDNIIKIILLGIIIIVPIIFFWYAGYVCLAALAAQIYSANSIENLAEMSRFTLKIFNYFFIEYFIYLGITLLNYVLYKKKWKKILVAINGMIIVAFVIQVIIDVRLNNNFLLKDLYIFLVAALIGLAFALRLNSVKSKRKN